MAEFIVTIPSDPLMVVGSDGNLLLDEEGDAVSYDGSNGAITLDRSKAEVEVLLDKAIDYLGA